MMIRSLCFSLLMLLVLSRAVLAQTPATPAPWPPDPAAIFAEGIEWSAIEHKISPIQTSYKSNIIRVLDADTQIWHGYPYPDAERSFSVSMLPSGLVWVELSKGLYERPLPGEAFLLDPKTGRYTQPTTVCDGLVIQAESGKGRWLAAYRDEAKIDAFLCQSETGEQRHTLPSHLTDWDVSPDPTMTHLVAIGRDVQDEERFEVYAYRLADNQLMQLGIFKEEGVTDVRVTNWLSDTRGVLRGWGDYRDRAAFMEFEINQPYSMKPSSYASGWNQDTFRLENPIRYVSATVDEYVTSKAGLAPVGMPCTVSIYDATGEREQQIANDCIPILMDRDVIAPFYRQGNNLYFLTTTGKEASVSSIVRYDIETEMLDTEAVYFSGEIENIVSVSPNGQYLVVLMDDNGILEPSWKLVAPMTDGLFVTVIDTEEHRIVYQSDLLGVYDTSQVVWIDNTTMVIIAAEIFRDIRAGEDGEVFPYFPSATLRQIHMDGKNWNTTRSMTMEEGEWISISHLNPRYGLHNGNTVIDLRSFEMVPIFRDNVLETYSTRMYRDEETSDLVVSVSLPDDSSSTDYRVTLP